jgi:hypothetical protein
MGSPTLAAGFLFGQVFMSLAWGKEPLHSIQVSCEIRDTTSRPPFKSTALQDSLAIAKRFVEYLSLESGYGFRYDSRQARIVDLKGGGLEFRRGSHLVAKLELMDSGSLGGYLPVGSKEIQNAGDATPLPDTVYAAAVRCMVNSCQTDGIDLYSRLEWPPTKVVRDTTDNGVPFVKIWCDCGIHKYPMPTLRFPVGPLYCVNVSSPGKLVFVKILHDWSSVTPKEVEIFLDRVIKTIHLVRQ